MRRLWCWIFHGAHHGRVGWSSRTGPALWCSKCRKWVDHRG